MLRGLVDSGRKPTQKRSPHSTLLEERKIDNESARNSEELSHPATVVAQSGWTLATSMHYDLY